MKSKGLILFLISLFSGLIILITIFLVLALTKGFNFKINFTKGISSNLVVEKVYSNEFDSISINTTLGDIYIENSTDNNIKLLVYSDKDKTEVKDNNNTLDVKVSNKKCKFFCFLNKDKVVLYLPTNYDKEIKVKSNYGDISISDFKNAIMDLSVDYGDIDIASVNKVTIDSDYGDVKIDSVNSYLDIETDYGDIKIDTVTLDTDSRIKNSFGDVTIHKTNEIHITASTSMGSANVEKNYPDSDISLIIKDSMGDIKVNK